MPVLGFIVRSIHCFFLSFSSFELAVPIGLSQDIANASTVDLCFTSV